MSEINPKFNIRSFVEGNKIILESGFTDMQEEIRRRIIDTEEHAVRQSLIALGWTPPSYKENTKPTLSLDEMAESEGDLMQPIGGKK